MKASFGIFDAEDIVIAGAEVLRGNSSKYFQARESQQRLADEWKRLTVDIKRPVSDK